MLRRTWDQADTVSTHQARVLCTREPSINMPLQAFACTDVYACGDVHTMSDIDPPIPNTSSSCKICKHDPLAKSTRSLGSFCRCLIRCNAEHEPCSGCRFPTTKGRTHREPDPICQQIVKQVCLSRSVAFWQLEFRTCLCVAGTLTLGSRVLAPTSRHLCRA